MTLFFLKNVDMSDHTWISAIAVAGKSWPKIFFIKKLNFLIYFLLKTLIKALKTMINLSMV